MLPLMRSVVVCAVVIVAVFVVVVAGGCGGVVVAGVAPAEVAAGGVVEVRGAGFDDTARIQLEGSPGTITVATTPTSEQVLQGTLPASTPAGVYDVVVIGSSGEGRLVGALNVVAGELRVVFVDVGQGDGALLVFPDRSTLLLDGGPRDAAGAMRDAIDEFGDGHLDAVAVTHTDADHLGGVVGVLRGDDGDAGTDDDVVPATRWIGHDDGTCDSQLCDEYRRLRGAPFEVPDVGAVVEHGGATVTVVARDGVVVGGAPLSDIDDPNERSLGLLVEFGGRSVFLGGDLTGGGLGMVDVEAEVAAATGPVDVLKLNHHGSQTSSSAGFLATLQPRAVVISVGTDNSFCHPEASVMARLRDSGVPLYATGDGMVSDTDCATTQWPAGAHHGVGTITLVIAADGAITLDGDRF